MKQNYMMNTYQQFPVTFVKGEGNCLIDDKGDKYLDFVAGIAVNSLGYSDEAFKDALKAQVDELLHVSNLYFNTPQLEAAEMLAKAGGMDRVFFCNSGTEAVEGAIKLARKYFAKKGLDKWEIIAMHGSFHGRTYGAITLTGQDKYRKELGPLLPGVMHATYNDLESVQKMINDSTGAIILEIIQGEGGIVPGTEEFIYGVAELCKEKELLLILDEVQTGVGRTGKVYGYQHFDIQPDIIASAKGLGNGIPVGAVLAKEEVAAGFSPGDHASTFGGNLLATTAVMQVLKAFEEKDLLNHVNDISEYLTGKLKVLKDKYEFIDDVRGKGLMMGIKVNIPPKDIVMEAFDQKLLLVGAGADVIRLVPPLTITVEEVDQCIEILDGIFENCRRK